MRQRQTLAVSIGLCLSLPLAAQKHTHASPGGDAREQQTESAALAGMAQQPLAGGSLGLRGMFPLIS